MAGKGSRKAFGPHPSRRGSETKRAREHGRSLKAQAEVDKHSANKTIRGKGVFALNAIEHKFKQAGKKKGTAIKGKSSSSGRKAKGARMRKGTSLKR